MPMKTNLMWETGNETERLILLWFNQFSLLLTRPDTQSYVGSTSTVHDRDVIQPALQKKIFIPEAIFHKFTQKISRSELMTRKMFSFENPKLKNFAVLPGPLFSYCTSEQISFGFQQKLEEIERDQLQ